MNEVLETMNERVEISYNEAHNVIFGALEFAKEGADADPHGSFEITKYILEEDTDEIPLIEYSFGDEDNIPYLVVDTKFEANKYLPKLRAKFGNDIEYLIKTANVKTAPLDDSVDNEKQVIS